MNQPTPDDARLITPSARLDETIGVLTDMERALASRGDLLRRVQDVTGLYLGELQALAVVAAGGGSIAAVVEATGQVPGAVEATVESLRERGMVAVGPVTHDGATLTITPAGRVAVQRAEGVQVRLMDVVVSALSPAETERLRDVLRDASDAIPTAGPRPVR